MKFSLTLGVNSKSSIFLDKIEKTEDKGFIPLLQAWEKIDYRKVREEIAKVINHLEKDGDMPDKVIDLREYRLRKPEVKK